MAELALDRISKVYDDGTVAVEELSLEIGDGEMVIFVGPSGCGKTTALRMIAGLEEISDGELRIDGEVVNDLPPQDRDMAMVFQNYALYPHMTVRQNMSFGLSRARSPSLRSSARSRSDRDARPHRASRPQARPPLRRPAPACGDRSGDCARPQGVPDG